MREIVATWFSLTRPVGPRFYAASGIGLALTKYAMDALLVWAATGRLWTPLAYVHPSLAAREAVMGVPPPWVFWALVLWSLPFYWIGISMTVRRTVEGSAAAIRVAAVVAASIALAGDMSQDLKTGALVGATPWKLQLGEMVGAAVAALRAGWVLFLLHKAYGIGSAMLPAPQAKLMATLADGVMHGDLPWRLLGLGAALALAAEACGVASLPFAIGLYLPITTSAPLILGGLAAWHLDRRPRAAEQRERLTLLASGLVAGDALMGIGVAALVVSGAADRIAFRSPTSGGWEDAATLIPFMVLLVAFLRAGSASWDLDGHPKHVD